MNCNPGNYTLKELKALCVQNKLKSSGTKIELIKRLENIKFDWCAHEKNKTAMKKINATEQTGKIDRDENNGNGEEQSSENEIARSSDNDGDTMTATVTHTYKGMQETEGSRKVTGSCEINVNNENEIVQCSERQMVSASNNESNKCLAIPMASNNDPEMQMAGNKESQQCFGNQMMRNNVTIQDSDIQRMENELKILKLQNEIDQLKNKQQRSNDTDSSISFEILKEIVKKNFKVGDEMMRALIHYKVKGDAEIWLYSSTSATMDTADKMLSHLEKMFVMSKESKLSMRQKLQNCVWIKGEEFSKYYNEKWQLADNLAMAEDEFLEYVIDGIHDVNLRNLAKSRSFKTGLELLEAFRNVELGYVPKPKLPEDRRAGDFQKPRGNAECYNCHSRGHLAKECRKPKRQDGACYACGLQGHVAKECNQYKKSKGGDNDYVSYIELTFCTKNNRLNPMFIECLIDSGSPISIIKKRFIPSQIKMEKTTSLSYVGLNLSKLLIHGSVKCSVKFSNKDTPMLLYVVDDESMGYAMLLGRDFLARVKAKIVIDNEHEKISEIKKDSIVEENQNTNKESKSHYETNADEQNNFEKQLLLIDYNDNENV
ncbi:uncharacterized protein LOC120458930 isoform X1 [Drosophila santomea]|uniref:uncharacterized protein LOC120458930 isoform X1 n=1 Tax=Drosophila santomea TaxID=129105 RepID=UPI00195390E7|nr:uncharacterized protein LOC120458930 isoform X1 [Drosophila santomea]